jgi:hypothetical protein
MNSKKFLTAMAAMAFVLIMTGCATKAPNDYSAFKESRPRSILVLPPVNKTPEVRASYSVLSHVTRPLAEAGYYVMPVTLVAEAFKENGMTEPSDMHATSAEKLRQIFGADAALYITISEYGTVYRVVDSAAIVTAKATMRDLKTGKTLWEGAATASSNEGGQRESNPVLLLLTAIGKQVVGTLTDESHQVANVTTVRLLSARQPGSTGECIFSVALGQTGGCPNVVGILSGPRSPNFGKE